MTKRREPLTYQRTLEIVAATIGWDNAAAMCGVSQRSVRNWSDHDCQQEIRMIEAALKRLDEGEYGFCTKCGAVISAERLDVLPHTPFCRTCAR